MNLPGCPYSVKKVVPTRSYRISANSQRSKRTMSYRWYSCLFVPACAGHEVAVEHTISGGAVQCFAYSVPMPSHSHNA